MFSLSNRTSLTYLIMRLQVYPQIKHAKTSCDPRGAWCFSSVNAVTPGCKSSDEILVKNAQNLLQTVIQGVRAAEHQSNRLGKLYSIKFQYYLYKFQRSDIALCTRKSIKKVVEVFILSWMGFSMLRFAVLNASLSFFKVWNYLSQTLKQHR